MTDIYSLQATSLTGQSVDLAQYKGKVVLIVNTASQCGFTPQYAGLEALYQRYRERGFVVLGFPCNQFGGQEPGGAAEISQTCQINYGVTFPMFSKVEVNGPNAHPLFALLTQTLPGWLGRPIRWNFTKFLIGRDGRPLKRFASLTKPAALSGAIEKALAVNS